MVLCRKVDAKCGLNELAMGMRGRGRCVIGRGAIVLVELFSISIIEIICSNEREIKRGKSYLEASILEHITLTILVLAYY